MSAERFGAFIQSLHLRHFQPWKFHIGLNRGNTLPPEYLWPNIVVPAVVVDLLRDTLDRPITITSAYRSPEYNRQAKGTPRSQHMAFAALDFKVSGTSARAVAGLCRDLRGQWIELPFLPERVQYIAKAGPVPFAELEAFEGREGQRPMVRFAGGVGEYPSFTHIDGRGLNHGWTGQ